MSNKNEWHGDYDNVLALANWLDDESCFESATDAIYFFEKPWKWSREWELYQAHESTADPKLKRLLVVAVEEWDEADAVIDELYTNPDDSFRRNKMGAI